MADEALVTLTAVDNVSEPIARAVSSIRQMESAIDSMAGLGGQTAESLMRTTSGVLDLNAAQESSVIPHRAAHQALSLVASDLTAVAGGSEVAHGAVRVLDSVLFQMAVTGGAVSIGFIALVAAAVGIGSVMRSASEDTKKEQESLDKLTESTIKSVQTLDYLNAAQKSVAGVGAAQLGEQVTKLKTQISDLTDKMKENAAEMIRLQQPQTLAGLERGEAGPTDTSAQSAAQVKMTGELRVLQLQLKNTQHEFDLLTQKSGAYHSAIKSLSEPLMEFSAQNEREAEELATIGQALGNVDAGMDQVAATADRMGVTYIEAARTMSSMNSILKTGIEEVSMTLGATLGNAIMGAKHSWQEGLKSMVAAVFDAATQVVLAAAFMNKAITAAFIPGTFIGILAMVAVLQTLKAVAVSALSSAANEAATNAQAATGTSSGQTSAVPNNAGAGGTAVSSAQKEIINNVSVNLGVQALDLSAISDNQLKSLANRIGRVLADAAGQGQFSLAGA